MGKLFFSRLIILTIFAISPIVIGQEYYCVFKVDGGPLLNDSIPLQKGVFINSGQFLRLNEKDEVVLLDDNGTIYELDKKMYIPFKNIEKFSKRPEQSSFTMKYLKFIWNKLWQDEEKENIGVVFRSSRSNQLIAPLDSVSIYKSEIAFSWLEKQAGEDNFIFIRKNREETFLKFTTNGNTLALPVHDILLERDNTYYWSVSTDATPEKGELDFNTFQLLSEDSFNLKMEDVKEIWKEFKILGFTEEEIRTTFCEDNRLCFD